jgi:murein L,D-transpeptidase YafK
MPGEPVAPTHRCPASVGAFANVDLSDARLQSDDLVVVFKSTRRIARYRAGNLVHTKQGVACWRTGLGPTPTGHKQREGDGKTPEGWYRSSDKPWSQWYAAIAIHYPNARDAKLAQSDGRLGPSEAERIQRKLNAGQKPFQTSPLGGEILIHGGGSASDWTLGCVAMDNDHIDALRATLPADKVTDVLILP